MAPEHVAELRALGYLPPLEAEEIRSDEGSPASEKVSP
jgi:hypothetical protein